MWLAAATPVASYILGDDHSLCWRNNALEDCEGSTVRFESGLPREDAWFSGHQFVLDVVAEFPGSMRTRAPGISISHGNVHFCGRDVQCTPFAATRTESPVVSGEVVGGRFSFEASGALPPAGEYFLIAHVRYDKDGDVLDVAYGFPITIQPDWRVIVSVIVGAVVASAIAAAAVWHRRHRASRANAMALPEGWTHCFLSHYKAEAGAAARLLKILVTEHLRERLHVASPSVFLDSDDLHQLTSENIRGRVGSTLSVIVLLSNRALTRPYVRDARLATSAWAAALTNVLRIAPARR